MFEFDSARVIFSFCRGSGGGRGGGGGWASSGECTLQRSCGMDGCESHSDKPERLKTHTSDVTPSTISVSLLRTVSKRWNIPTLNPKPQT